MPIKNIGSLELKQFISLPSTNKFINLGLLFKFQFLFTINKLFLISYFNSAPNFTTEKYSYYMKTN